jgi:hypothetical protein
LLKLFLATDDVKELRRGGGGCEMKTGNVLFVEFFTGVKPEWTLMLHNTTRENRGK